MRHSAAGQVTGCSSVTALIKRKVRVLTPLSSQCVGKGTGEIGTFKFAEKVKLGAKASMRSW